MGAEGANRICHGIRQNSQAKEPGPDKTLESYISPKGKSSGIISQVKGQSNSGFCLLLLFLLGVNMRYVIITNNDMMLESFNKENVIFTKDVKTVFEIAREYINSGYHFYMHPLSLNIDVHKIPVRSLVLTPKFQSDMDEISLIDSVLEKEFCSFDGKLDDFKEIDAQLVTDVLKEVRR